MPPVGNFSVPASTSKENKSRKRNHPSNTSGTQANAIAESSSRGLAPGGKV